MLVFPSPALKSISLHPQGEAIQAWISEQAHSLGSCFFLSLELSLMWSQSLSVILEPSWESGEVSAGPDFQRKILETTELPGEILEKNILGDTEKTSGGQYRHWSLAALLQEVRALLGHPDFLLQEHNPHG